MTSFVTIDLDGSNQSRRGTIELLGILLQSAEDH